MLPCWNKISIVCLALVVCGDVSFGDVSMAVDCGITWFRKVCIVYFLECAKWNVDWVRTIQWNDGSVSLGRWMLVGSCHAHGPILERMVRINEFSSQFLHGVTTCRETSLISLLKEGSAVV